MTTKAAKAAKAAKFMGMGTGSLSGQLLTTNAILVAKSDHLGAQSGRLDTVELTPNGVE
jgi:hypothetical protein